MPDFRFGSRVLRTSSPASGAARAVDRFTKLSLDMANAELEASKTGSKDPIKRIRGQLLTAALDNEEGKTMREQLGIKSPQEAAMKFHQSGKASLDEYSGPFQWNTEGDSPEPSEPGKPGNIKAVPPSGDQGAEDDNADLHGQGPEANVVAKPELKSRSAFAGDLRDEYVGKVIARKKMQAENRGERYAIPAWWHLKDKSDVVDEAYSLYGEDTFRNWLKTTEGRATDQEYKKEVEEWLARQQKQRQ